MTPGVPPQRIYLDGNSLGPPLAGVRERLVDFVDREWSADLIAGWNDHGWWDLPTVVGDRIAPLIGAAPGQTIVADSTTVLLYKLASAALAIRPGKRWIVTAEPEFPTDRHILSALAAQHGLEVEAVAPDQVADALCGDTALVCLSHVNYRTGERLDLAGVTEAAHGHGALVLWDLSHSVGAMDLALDAAGVDLAVGCTYKYLNGGPGAPAFAYVAERHLPDLRQPISGWTGTDQPFAMSPVHVPAPGIRRLLSGTPPVIALVTLDAALRAWDGADMAAVRRRSLELTDRFIAGADRLLAPLGFEVVTPRDHDRRGSQVSLAHLEAYGVVRAALAAGVVGDYRAPGICRFGFAPLYVTDDDVDQALERIGAVVASGAHLDPAHHVQAAVT